MQYYVYSVGLCSLTLLWRGYRESERASERTEYLLSYASFRMHATLTLTYINKINSENVFK